MAIASTDLKIVSLLVNVYVDYGASNRKGHSHELILRVHICDHADRTVAYALGDEGIIEIHDTGTRLEANRQGKVRFRLKHLVGE